MHDLNAHQHGVEMKLVWWREGKYDEAVEGMVAHHLIEAHDMSSLHLYMMHSRPMFRHSVVADQSCCGPSYQQYYVGGLHIRKRCA